MLVIHITLDMQCLCFLVFRRETRIHMSAMFDFSFVFKGQYYPETSAFYSNSGTEI